MKLRLLAVALVFACTPADEEETATTDPETSASASDPDTSAGTNPAELGCAFPEVQDTTDGTQTPIMDAWSSACTTDAECVERIGEGAVCLFEAVIYELPGGFCTKPCTLPDTATRVVLDDPACDPNGGVACVGQNPTFMNCAIICTDDAQCNRDGYVCRQMPLIAEATDPSICLMPDCCQETCEE